MVEFVGGPAAGHPYPLPGVVWVATDDIDGETVPLLDPAGRVVLLPTTPSPEAEVVLDKAACRWEAYRSGTDLITGLPVYRHLPRDGSVRYPIVAPAS